MRFCCLFFETLICSVLRWIINTLSIQNKDNLSFKVFVGMDNLFLTICCQNQFQYKIKSKIINWSYRLKAWNESMSNKKLIAFCVKLKKKITNNNYVALVDLQGSELLGKENFDKSPSLGLQCLQFAIMRNSQIIRLQ